jgi:hypothetical protein
MVPAALLVLAAAVWQPLFDGRTLEGWKETPYARHPAVKMEAGTLLLPNGAPLTGVTRTAPFPRLDYELRFEARRVRGGDFFASLTFPVGDASATWVTGGWGGDIVGISSIDGWDASDNETRSYFNFETGRWYAFRIKVTAGRILAWIDDQPVVNVKIDGRTLSLRHGEIGLSAPLGFASYNTAGEIRKAEYRTVAP